MEREFVEPLLKRSNFDWSKFDIKTLEPVVPHRRRFHVEDIEVPSLPNPVDANSDGNSRLHPRARRDSDSTMNEENVNDENFNGEDGEEEGEEFEGVYSEDELDSLYELAKSELDALEKEEREYAEQCAECRDAD